MRALFACLAALGITAVLSSPTQAAVITVFSNNFAGWTAAAGSPVIVEDFSDGTLVPGLSIVSGNGTISGLVYNDVVDFPVNSADDQVTFGFNPAITAFGGNFNLTPGGAGLGITLVVFFEGGGSQVVATEVPESFSGQFFGFVSDTPISSVQLRGGTQGGAQETFTLDNLSFASQVPEPTSLVVFGVMAVSAGFFGYRRRKQTVPA